MILPLLTAALFAVPAQDSVHVRVLAMTDFHGALESRASRSQDGRLLGGAAVLKAAMDSAEARCACLTLRIDAGDQMQGTLVSNLFYGASTVEALNLIGLDAAAIGNHELDWSVDTLRQRMREAEYPWLAANVFDSATGRRPDWARPYHIIERAGLRVAVIGFVTASAKTLVYAPNVAGLEFREGADAIADVVTAVRAESPDLTILTAHAGVRCDGDACRGEILSLARGLDPEDVDLIVAGHPHTVVVTEENGIPIVQAGANGTSLGVIDLVRVDGGPWRVQAKVLRVFADQVTPDASVLAAIAQYRPRADSLANRHIATLAEPATKGRGEGPLGNMIADAQRAATSADVAIMTNGGIRTSLPAGPVTYGMLYAVQPFDNRMVRITITGRDLRRLLEQVLEGAHVSGVEIRFDPARPSGRRIIDVTLADGRRLADDEVYSLGVSNFLAEGGDGLVMLRDLPREDMGIGPLDAFIAYLERSPQPVAITHEVRIVAVGR